MVHPPCLFPGRGVHRVEKAVARADEDAAVRHRGRGLNGPAVEAELARLEGVALRVEAPELPPALRVERVQRSVGAAGVHPAVRHGWRGAHPSAGGEAPADPAAPRVHRVHVAVAAAEVERTTCPCGRRGVEVAALEAPREGDVAAGLEPPALLAGARVHRPEGVVAAPHEHEPVGDGRGRGNRASGAELPAMRAGPRVERVEKPIAAPDVERPVVQRRGGLDHAAGLHPPLQAAEPAERRGGVDTRMGRVAAEHGCGLLRGGERGDTDAGRGHGGEERGCKPGHGASKRVGTLSGRGGRVGGFAHPDRAPYRLRFPR